MDGTPYARDAVVLAALLGEATGAELMLIAVVEEPLVLLPSPNEGTWKTIQKQARTLLEETRAALAPNARIVVQTGTLVWRTLENVARRQHRDLLVIGSGRRGPDGQVHLGQDARALLGELECALAVAPRGMREVREPRLERIGVGFDGNPEAHAALELAAAITKAADAELKVVGVVDDRVTGGLRTEQIVLDGEAIVSRQEDALLERALVAAEATGVPARVQISPGDPAEELQSLAADVDLLVIGSSRSGPSGRPSLGRTGNALANGSPAPLLITPKPG
ncbi:MAG TPA: universal stress protein [Solirubrobacteraceae bacterium]|nr:universal stress protein [Solirubrobacteraceae bacterium]